MNNEIQKNDQTTWNVMEHLSVIIYNALLLL